MLARISILTLAAVLPLILHVEQAEACSCLPPGPPAEAYQDATDVFVGRVLSVEEIEEMDPDFPFPELQVTLAVERAFKGVAGNRAIVRTATNSAACGYHFALGTAHLVYARRGETGVLGVSLCSRTQPLEHAAEDIAALEEIVGATPAAPDEPGTPSPGQVPPGKGGCAGCASTAGAGGSGFVLLGLLVGLWLARVRHREVSAGVGRAVRGAAGAGGRAHRR